MEAEPRRCITCMRTVYQNGGGHLETCPDRPHFAKGYTDASGSSFEPLHRPLPGAFDLPRNSGDPQ